MRKVRIATAAVAALALAACGGGSLFGGNHPKISATCPPPPLSPTPPPAFLDYPPSGSANVSTSIGQIIEKGADVPGGGITIVVASGSENVPLGTPTTAPSPFPTPFATPPPTFGMIAPYIAIPLPTLSPSTVYTVSDVYAGYDPNNPPQCSAPTTQLVGTFTTGS
ncbi:MAG TPA: hypothetical protein VIO32_08760 [Candidatus Baltobacteraceae bacterium]